MRWWLAGSVCLLCTGFGMTKNYMLYLRAQVLNDCVTMLRQMVQQLTYPQKTTKQMLEALAQESLLQRLTFLSESLSYMDAYPFPTAWKRAVREGQHRCYLLEEDVLCLQRVADILGHTDAKEQQEALQDLLLTVQSKQEGAQTQWEQKGKLSRSLGLLCGIGAAILVL